MNKVLGHLLKYTFLSFIFTALVFGVAELPVYLLYGACPGLSMIICFHLLAYVLLIPTFAFNEDDYLKYLEKLAKKKVELGREEIRIIEIENEKTRKLLEL